MSVEELFNVGLREHSMSELWWTLGFIGVSLIVTSVVLIIGLIHNKRGGKKK